MHEKTPLRRSPSRPSSALSLRGFSFAFLAVLALGAVGCTPSATENGQSKPAPATGEKARKTDDAPTHGTAPAASATRFAAAQPAASKGEAVAEGHEVAILAGGCFWGMEEILRGIDGVVDTDVGYAGGITLNPTYGQVSTGASGHAESVRVVFDPKRLSYDELLAKWFFRMHDPTTPNRQGNDIGTQYRSAIFYTSPEQQTIAEAVKKRVNESGQWKSPVVTEIAKAGPFTLAEDYHQDYLQRIPDGYTCHYMREDLEFPVSLPEE